MTSFPFDTRKNYDNDPIALALIALAEAEGATFKTIAKASGSFSWIVPELHTKYDGTPRKFNVKGNAAYAYLVEKGVIPS